MNVVHVLTMQLRMCKYICTWVYVLVCAHMKQYICPDNARYITHGPFSRDHMDIYTRNTVAIKQKFT